MKVYFVNKNYALDETGLRQGVLQAVCEREKESFKERVSQGSGAYCLQGDNLRCFVRIVAEPLCYTRWEELVDELRGLAEESTLRTSSYVFFSEMGQDLRDSLSRIKALYKPLFEKTEFHFFRFEPVAQGEDTGLALDEVVLYERPRPYIKGPQMSREEQALEQNRLNESVEPYHFYRQARLSPEENIAFFDLELEFQRLFPG